MRRHRAGLALALLLAVTAAVVWLATRPGEPPSGAAATSPPLSGVVAALGPDHQWRWVGPQDCVPAADAVPVERMTPNGWAPGDVPLVTVTGLSFADPRHGIAVGTDEQCGLGAALTSDGGATWTQVPGEAGALSDAWYQGRHVWGIARLAGPAQLGVYRVSDGRLVPLRTATPVCDARDGAPSLTAFVDTRQGYLLCEQQAVADRLLARTLDGGRHWERLTDARPVSGLDGVGPIRDLDVVVGRQTTVWALFPPGECPEGQLRRSGNGGGTFDRLPCPSESTPVDAALSVSFWSAHDGVMLALRHDRPTMLTTDDGGSTWSTR